MKKLTLAAAVLGLAAMVFGAEATSSGKMSLDISKAEPRQVEEAPQQAIVRDYGKAWQNMSAALEQNRADLLGPSFTGFAKDKLTKAIEDQKKNGLKRKYIDRGHKLQVVFYSVEGSAMELRDTAQVEIQLLDGSKVVHSEQATVNYVALLTPTENSWKVRMLEAEPQ
ncbi:MAG TPA: hypothetical protein VLU54_13155 [Casimicrobiaceae bacterium]|nr:hypothetical protein [Casimicrobiaceae bacterium]